MGSERQKVEYALNLQFPATNNVIEYEVLILSLELAQEVGAKIVKVYCDSQLIVKKVNRIYEASDQSMVKYLAKAK